MLMDLLDPSNSRHSLACPARSENEHRPNQRNKSESRLCNLVEWLNIRRVSNFPTAYPASVFASIDHRMSGRS